MPSGGIPDFEEEVPGIPVAESKAFEALDHVVRTFERSIGDGERHVGEDAVHAFLDHPADPFQFKDRRLPGDFQEHREAIHHLGHVGAGDSVLKHRSEYIDRLQLLVWMEDLGYCFAIPHC